MAMPKEYIELRKKIEKGMEIAHQKLIQETKEKNSYLVVSRNGKIVKIHAKDL